jgi:dienelactone hydrolase
MHATRTSSSVQPWSGNPFDPAVAYYHGCDRPGRALDTDTLILIGDADDSTPVDLCARWRDEVQRNGHFLRMKTYPGARHDFDSPLPLHYFAGQYVGQDPSALADALAETADPSTNTCSKR